MAAGAVTRFSLFRAWAHQRWIPFGIRDRALRFFRPPEQAEGRKFQVPYFGLNYWGDFGNYIDWSVYYYGAYELGLLRLLDKASSPGAVFLDIGANVGAHTLFMATRSAQVHSFEPWPVAADRLEKAIRGNGLRNVSLHRYGLSDQSGRLPYYAPASANLGTGSFHDDVNDNKPVGELQVRRGDEVALELGLDRIDVIKIDVEGFEGKVLTGMRSALVRCGPVVVVEVALLMHEGGVDAAAWFPEDWMIMAASSHPEKCVLTPFSGLSTGEGIVTLVAGPPEKIKALTA